MKKSGISSIRSRLLGPLTAILLIQALILFILVVFGGVSQRLRLNAIDILKENTENTKLQMERNLVQFWIGDIKMSDAVTANIEQVLREQGKTPADIHLDPELNRDIVYAAMPSLINTLHRSYGNGMFMILDGPAASNGAPGTKAGVYIRDLDQQSYAEDNSDLLLERGLPSVSKTFGIALDSFWELGFQIDQSEKNEYFNRPYNLVRNQKIPKKQATSYGYLGGLMSLVQMDTRVLTFSFPLILSDGTAVGVIGGDMTEDQVRQAMKRDTTSSEQVIQILGRRRKGSNCITPIVTSSALFQTYFGEADRIVCEKDGNQNIDQTTDKNGDLWYAGTKIIEIYDPNTPFEYEEWVVLRLEKKEDVFRFYDEVRNTLLAALAVSVLFGLAAVLLTGSIITAPIGRLVHELRVAPRGKKISLSRTQIDEVDELIEAVEGMSADVAAVASKLSNVLEAAGVPLGVYETNRQTGAVFISKTLLEIVGKPQPEENYCYLSEEEFGRLMQELKLEENWEDDVLFTVERDKEKRWLRLKRVPGENGNEIGVLTDVTSDIVERKKLEKERNYDLLTNIYNRRAFREAAEDAIARNADGPMAFVMWDLDNLKYVNDTYGHEEGDRYIRKFADYLKTLEQYGVIVERHSGDEFMAVFTRGSKKEQTGYINAFMDGMKAITLRQQDGYCLPLRASAGIAWYPENATEFDTLVRYADFAMYMAKHSVKGIVREFTAESFQENAYLLSGNEELNLFLEEGRVEYALQPIVDRNGEIYGYEALMRPHLEHLKNIQDVLNIAKIQAKLNQMERLTWFTAMKCFDKLERENKLAQNSRFFINSIASVRLNDADLERLETSYPRLLNRVVLEINESEPDEASVALKMEKLAHWNGLIAIDDFGSGYSNEGVLLKLHPDIVKLDITLIHGIDQNEEQKNMTGNLITLCHQKGILVAAEGVETAEELKTLLQMDIDLFQGYYLARPEREVCPLNPDIVEEIRRFSKK